MERTWSSRRGVHVFRMLFMALQIAWNRTLADVHHLSDFFLGDGCLRQSFCEGDNLLLPLHRPERVVQPVQGRQYQCFVWFGKLLGPFKCDFSSLRPLALLVWMTSPFHLPSWTHDCNNQSIYRLWPCFVNVEMLEKSQSYIMKRCSIPPF